MDVKRFTDDGNIFAVIGVSSDHEKWGWKIFNELKISGFKVYAVNPKYDKIDDEKCYPDLESLPHAIDVAILVVPPYVTENVVMKCKETGIKKVWMQPGSESDDAIKFCEKNGIEVVHNACFVVDGMKKQFS